VQYGHAVTRLGAIARRHALDLVIVLLALESALELFVRQDSDNTPTTTLWFTVPALTVAPLVLLLRRRFPFGAPAVYWVLGVALSFVDGNLVTFATSTFIAGMIASFLLGNLHDAVHARVGLGIAVGGAAIVVYNQPTHTAGELVFIPLLFGICWLGGFALGAREEQAEAAELRASQAEREREAAARIAVAEERARIARELHDVVAHAVSVMVLQVGVVRHQLPEELAEEEDALRGVEETGRSALAEMRRLLGAMRSEGTEAELSPQPSLERLDALAAEVGRAGLPVTVHVEGEPMRLPPAIDLSAYRIVQEGLTNALKHAHAAHADVTVRYRPDRIELEVRDDGAGASKSDGLGHGLVGIRERVKIYGGEMTAGPANGGGFVLSTRLPLEGEPA
jgi:signal transduction histidine kinase